MKKFKTIKIFSVLGKDCRWEGEIVNRDAALTLDATLERLSRDRFTKPIAVVSETFRVEMEQGEILDTQEKILAAMERTTLLERKRQVEADLEKLKKKLEKE